MIQCCSSKIGFDVIKRLLSGERLSKKEILNCLNNNSYSLQEIDLVLKNFVRRDVIRKEKIKNINHYYITYNKNYLFDLPIQIKKEKNILLLISSNGNIIQYDFLNQFFDFYFYAKSDSDCAYWFYCPDRPTSFEEFLLSELMQKRGINTPEWIFSYLDQIDFNYIAKNEGIAYWNYYLPDQCKKGYMAFIKEHHLQISRDTAIFFDLCQQIQKPYVEVKFLYEVMRYNYITTSPRERIIKYIIAHPEIVTNLYQTYLTTAKRGETCSWMEIARMLSEIVTEKYDFNIDTNRTFNYNVKNFNTLKISTNIQKIKEQQRRIINLNNQEIDKYIIKIPVEIEELQDEGQQQNNCVGTYYNKDIADGTDLIYFIRKKNNPKKSFITCRFNIKCKSTVEHKYKNNRAEEGLSAIRNEIDKQIIQLLSL